MYNEKYYQDRKLKIRQKITEKQTEFVNDILMLVQRFVKERQDLSIDFKEIMKQEVESKTETKQFSKEDKKNKKIVSQVPQRDK